MADKIYCGTGKKGQYSIKLNLSIDRIPGEWITEKNGKRYIRLELNERKSPDQYGNTHSISVDTWRKPDGDAQDHQNAHQQAKQNGYAPQDDSQDLPW